MVVLSLSIVMRLAWPRSLSVTFSSLMPRSSLTTSAAGEDRDVLEHGLAAVTEARRLDGGHVQRATQLVHHERGQGLALDVLGDDDERLLAARHGLEHEGSSPSCWRSSSRR
jgi:hypothetical protein